MQISYGSLAADLFTTVRSVPTVGGLNGNPARCAVTAGALPPGVSLASDCSIGGAPTQTGAYGATVTVTVDGFNGSASAPVAVTITGPTLQKIKDPSAGSADQQLRLLAPVSSLQIVRLPSGVGLYSAQGGDTLGYAVASGTLPAGLTLNADGTLSGTPTAFGASTASIALTIARAGLTFTTAPVAVAFSTVEAPFTLSYFDCCVSAFVGDTVDMHPTSTHVAVPGATSRFTIDASSAPAGLALDPLTGVYSGRLSTAGSAFSVAITQTVTYPDGTTANARWTSKPWTVLAAAPPLLQYMQQVGSLADGAVSISILPTKYNGTLPAQINGAIEMAGFLGTQGFNIGAPVETIVPTQLIDATGRPYVSIALTSKTFNFIDLVTGARSLATMRTVSDNLPGTRGRIAFVVTAVATGAVLASSGIGGGQPLAITLTSGNTAIRGF